MNKYKIKKIIIENKYLYIMILPIIIYYIIFSYIPMIGIVVAFKDYTPAKGIFHSEWIGFRNFVDFFNSYYFWRLIKNTFLLNFYDLIFAFPIPIIFVLLLNEINNSLFKRFVQTVSYMPYFISLVVVVGLIADFTNSNGAITDLLNKLFGIEKINLLGEPKYFRSIYVLSNIWQYMGFNSIIYLAALSGIDQELYEAAMIDGAGRLRQTWHITLPGILNTIIILLILRIGNLMSVGFEKILLMYSPSTYEVGDVISTFVYRKGLQEFNYSYSTAVGLFNSTINFILLLTANKLSKKMVGNSLF